MFQSKHTSLKECIYPKMYLIMKAINRSSTKDGDTISERHGVGENTRTCCTITLIAHTNSLKYVKKLMSQSDVSTIRI